MTPHMLLVITGGLIMLIALLAGEEFARRSHISPAIMRKIGHVGMSLLVIAVGLIVGRHGVIEVSAFFALLLFFLHFFRPLKSISDRHSGSLGEVFFPIGVALTAFIAPTNADFVAAVLVLGLADTTAYFAGTRIKSPKLPFHKSIAGSLGFFVVASIILLFVTSWFWALPFAAALTIVEFLGAFGLDNLFIPVVAALLLYLVK